MALCTPMPEFAPEPSTNFLKCDDNLKCISNLPELEITPLPMASKPGEKPLNGIIRRKVVHTSKPKELKEERDIQKLLKKLPILDEHFNIERKIGEGTYSSVYLAAFKNAKSKKEFAVKHLTDNFSLSRIQKELRFMQIIGGCDNVVNVLNCFRNESKDCVVFVMPYLPHRRFSEYVLEMGANELRSYMKNLLIALKRVHSFNVIHRDVKPGNFLYNRDTKECLLVDFGLAQEVNDTPRQKIDGDGENAPINYSKRKRSSTDDGNAVSKIAFMTPLKSRENIMSLSYDSTDWRMNTSNTSSENKPPKLIPSERTSFISNQSPSISNLMNSIKNPLTSNSSFNSSYRTFSNKREASLGTSLLKSQTETKLAATPKNISSSKDQRCFTPLVGSKVPVGSFVQVRNSLVVADEHANCPCAGLGAICCSCTGKRTLLAPRAGTPGFRPPEVLLKYLHQTTAVDLWAVGVILLCILSGSYPFFRSPSDLAALAEIMTIFGTDAVANVASKFGRRIACSDYRSPLDIRKMCRRLRARKTKKPLPPAIGKCEVCQQSIRSDGCICRGEMPVPTNSTSDGDIFPDSAYHLLLRLLDLNPESRITAADALEHPFIKGI